MTAHLIKPICANSRLFLDSIVRTACVKDKLGSAYYDLPRFEKSKEVSELAHVTLPIMRVRGAFLSSEARYYIDKTITDKWRKRFNEMEAEQYKEIRTYRVDGGAYKNYNMPIELTYPKGGTISWIVIGIQDELQRLLDQHIKFIGKKGSQGWGEVSRWEIVPTTKKGVRLFPAELFKRLSDQEIYYHETVNPPYNNKKNIKKCVVRKF